MRRFLKYLLLAFASGAAIGGSLFYVVANHSIASELQLVCKGSFYKDGKRLEEETIYFKFLKYRWWVHLWSSSDGNGYVQKQDTSWEYLSHIQFLDGIGQIILDKGIGVESGRYSSMSRTMQYIERGSPFEGSCTERK